jgi:hypothetical protein
MRGRRDAGHLPRLRGRDGREPDEQDRRDKRDGRSRDASGEVPL